MNIFINNKNIYDDISLNYAAHEMQAENEADSLVLKFNDPKGYWSKWNLQPGDEISLEHEKAKSGKMFIYEASAQNGLYVIRAMSMPLSMKDVRTSSWRKVKLSQLAEEIASRHGLSVKLYDVKDQIYESIVQEESNIKFLNNICMLEGCRVIIYDGKVIIYDEQSREASQASDEIEIGKSGLYSYSDYRSHAYGSAKVFAGSYIGEIAVGSGRQLEAKIRANSNAEATRFAKGLLRYSNKSLQTGSFKLDFTPKYAPASVVNIVTPKAAQWNGKAFITKVSHDYVKNITMVSFRNINLEGY